MIPASILLIILVAADAISHIALWMRANRQDQRTQDVIREAFEAEHNAVVKVSDYGRDMSDLKYHIKAVRQWSKMPDDFKPL